MKVSNAFRLSWRFVLFADEYNRRYSIAVSNAFRLSWRFVLFRETPQWTLIGGLKRLSAFMTFCTILSMVNWFVQLIGLKRLSAFMTFCTDMTKFVTIIYIRSQTPFGFHDVLYEEKIGVEKLMEYMSQTPFGFHDVLYCTTYKSLMSSTFFYPFWRQTFFTPFLYYFKLHF